MDTSPSSSPLPSSSPITAVDLTSLNELDTSIEAVNDLLSLNSASTLDDDHEEKGEVDEEEEGEEEGVIGVDGGPDDVGGDILGLNSNNVDRVADVKREDTSSHPLSISPNRALANLTSMISRAKHAFYHKPLFKNTHTYKYGKSHQEDERHRRIKEEVEDLQRMRQEELHAFLPWESEAGMVARNAKAVNLPPLPRALMSSLYGKGDKGEEDKRELDLDVNLFSLAKEGRGEGKSEDGEAEFVRMPGGESILRVKQILKMWRMRQLLKAWMRWYKFSFTGSSAGTDGGMDAIWDAMDSSETVKQVISDAEQTKKDLTVALDVIDKLQQENSALSHQVKNLLLQTFGLKTAAITVIKNSTTGGAAKKSVSRGRLASSKY